MTAIATERMSAGPVDALTLVVAAREDVAESVVALTLVAPDGQPLPSWSPGAHVDLLLKPGLIRQYSLCGDPADAYTWRVAVLLDRAGRGGSGAVHGELLEGALVAVRRPRNNFPLIASPRYLFIAGGIGITPILPMILRAELDGAEWTLVYGGRHRGSMAFLPELAVLAGQPDHRDFVLDAGERAAGKTMMACVSRSRSPELRLDL